MGVDCHTDNCGIRSQISVYGNVNCLPSDCDYFYEGSVEIIQENNSDRDGGGGGLRVSVINSPQQ